MFAATLLWGALGAVATGAAAHEVSENDHHAFEHKYAEQCIARESRGNADPTTVRELCECIAKEESKRLTYDEVRKFVHENKYPVSLLIKNDAAVSVCAGQKL
jgi:YesN/AraC family two-component response regulator